MVELADPVGIADLEVLVGSHKGGKVREGSLVQEEGTSLVERHKACQGNQGQGDHLDPNYPAAEDRMVDNQDVDRKEDREEGGHVAAVVEFVGLEYLEEQMQEVGFDVAGQELVLLGEVEIRSARKIDQQAAQNVAIKTKVYITYSNQKEGNGNLHTVLRSRRQ